MGDWQVSTLVFVSDVDASIAFYVGKLGFTLNMRYEEKGRALVAGVSRGEDCPLLLTSQWPDRVGLGILYDGLGPAEFDAVRAELEGKGVPLKDGWWGKKLMIVEDPDGNQIYFADPHDDPS
jgi:catechol 2,3-dioxygenase-like lactoylglutathione lyase family enzyme